MPLGVCHAMIEPPPFNVTETAIVKPPQVERTRTSTTAVS